MKLSINAVMLFALISIKSCRAVALEPDQAGLDRRDSDIVQYRNFMYIASDDEPQGIQSYSLPELLGDDCKYNNMTNIEGMVVDQVGQGTQEGCTLWWEKEKCEGVRHEFSFPLYTEHVSNVVFNDLDNKYREGARSYRHFHEKCSELPEA